MNELKYKAGARVTVLNTLSFSGEHGWEERTEEEEGIYNSHDKNGIYVEVKMGDDLKLILYKFNEVSIKLEKEQGK